MDFSVVIAAGIIALVVWGVIHYSNKRKARRAREQYEASGPVSRYNHDDHSRKSPR